MTDQALNEFTQEMITLLRDSKSFILEQAPDVIQQVLRYRTVSHFIGLVFGIVFLLISARLLYASYVEHKKYIVDRETTIFIGGFVGIITGVIGLFIFFDSIDSLVKVYLAPKLYLIDYFSSLVRNRCSK